MRRISPSPARKCSRPLPEGRGKDRIDELGGSTKAHDKEVLAMHFPHPAFFGARFFAARFLGAASPRASASAMRQSASAAT